MAATRHCESVLRLPQSACYRALLSLLLRVKHWNVSYRNTAENPEAWGRWRSVVQTRSLKTQPSTQMTQQPQKQCPAGWTKEKHLQICICERVWRCKDDPRLISFHLRKLIWRQSPNCHNKYKSCTFKCNRRTWLERRESTRIDRKKDFQGAKCCRNKIREIIFEIYIFVLAPGVLKKNSFFHSGFSDTFPAGVVVSCFDEFATFTEHWSHISILLAICQDRAGRARDRPVCERMASMFEPLCIRQSFQLVELFQNGACNFQNVSWPWRICRTSHF